ncbi:MAG: alanine--tRNA ligase [Candidatus Aminicenantes bacterium]|nr:alanine--tRNA ligase [Candidatus Aminicenantes bacterium]
MRSQDIRDAFLRFFAAKDHKVVPSAPLLPKDDPTLLFTNAGMNPFKNVFLGLATRSYKRAASVQKCMRVSGKHNDLETVGRTTKHHTFFEMLGNFSFGDYFKVEACLFAWELVTETFRLSPERMVITVYEEDDEAFRIWNERVGIPADRIFRFGKKDNYWAMGETGPCGPCSEIHYDIDPGLEPGAPRDLIEKGSDRFCELWNLVFMEFSQDGRGGIARLPSPSIDTGMGLERMAAVLQGKTSNFETDLFRPLIDRVCERAGREYPARDEGDVSVRIIADHVRAATFLIGDGAMPANDGRGYVLRRLIRRAFRNGNLIGLETPFLFDLVGVVVDVMKDAYPELLASSAYIAKVCLSEEERFASTLASGLRYFRQYADEVRAAGGAVLDGGRAFKLYDTFGFPLDLTQDLAAEDGLRVDEAGFKDELEKQRSQARQSWKGEAKVRAKQAYESLKSLRVRFVGYEEASVSDAEVIGLIKDGRPAADIREGDAAEVVLDKTPFYAEMGGQVGDSGVLKNAGFSAVVETTLAPLPDVISHKVEVLSGALRLGDRVEAAYDAPRRNAIRRNHTATHLLHAALREILGDHVKQAGSLVSPSKLRFDFTHYAALRREEIARVEALVNERIWADLPVRTRETSLEEGIREGATAIFEEKYGEQVRVVSVGDISKELCGGVHVAATGQVGMVKIVSESSVAAGMRRIEAVSGEEALRFAQESDALLADLQDSLGIPRSELVAQVDRLRETIKDRDKEIKALRLKLTRGPAAAAEDAVREVKGVRVLTRKVEGLAAAELRELADELKRKIGSGVVVLGAVDGPKALLVVAVSKDLADRLRADAIIRKIAPLVGGGGGGRPEFAQAGGGRPEGLDRALEESAAAVEALL